MGHEPAPTHTGAANSFLSAVAKERECALTSRGMLDNPLRGAGVLLEDHKTPSLRGSTLDRKDPVLFNILTNCN